MSPAISADPTADTRGSRAPTYNALILCTGNSARSILGEALVNRLGSGRVTGFSAGSQPKGAPHPLAIELLASLGYSTVDLRSKSWDEFARPGAPRLDFVFTVCDNAAGEMCPVWPGGPLKAHWGIPDPAAVEGTERQRRAAFREAYDSLESRIRAFMRLDLDTTDRESLARRLREIGQGSAG